MIRFPQTLLDSLWFFQWFTTLSLWCNTQLPIVQLATCLGVASPKLHLVTRAATLVYESYCMLSSSKDVSGYALKSWKLLHSHTHVWKEMTYANNWCCCCSGNILQKFSVMNSRMFHDSLQFAVTTSHSHSRQKKKTKQQFFILLMRSFQWFQGTFSTRLRHMEYKTLALLLTWWPKKRLRLQKWNPNPQGGTNILPTFGKTLKSSFKLTFMGRYIHI